MRKAALAVPASVLIALGGLGAIPADATSRASAPLIARAVQFVTPDSADTGGYLPEHSAAGDFDGDGNLDAVTVNMGPTNVFGKAIGVALGDGAGHLGPKVTMNLGNGYGGCDLAVGNWNGDTMDDLVVIGCTTGGPGNLVALVATGGGHFTKTQSWAGVDLQIVAGDFDDDGNMDFVTSANGAPSVKTYLGKGDGTFEPPLTAEPPFDTYDLAVGDMDNDGNLDVIGAAGGPVWTMLGQGDGTFGEAIYRFSDVVTGIRLAIADLDEDGNLDVAVTDASDAHVNIGIGTGDGSFTDGDQISLGTRAAGDITAGKVTADGHVDLVASLDNDSNASALLRGKGDGHFAKAVHWVVGAYGHVSGDFDADGRSDLLTFVQSGRMYVSLAAGKGFYAARLARGPLSGDLADVNGDGILDKISGTTGFSNSKIRSQVIVQLGLGNGRFGKLIVSQIRNETAASGVGDIDVADINEDGFPDIVGGFSNFQVSPDNIFWMVGVGDGSFGPASFSNTGDVHADVIAIAASDINSDGHVDIIANDLSQLVVRLGKGDGTFGGNKPSGVGSGSDRAVLVGDFTGDGIKDVVTTVRTGSEDFGSGQIRLQQGTGTGSFNLIQTQNVDSNLTGGVKADLNDDGRPDVVTAGSRGSNGGRSALWVLLTTPGGMLGNPQPYLGPVGPVATGDVDVDGDLDIATPGFDTIDFYLNDGSGLFPDIEDILATGPIGAVVDLDGDGAPDVLSGSPLGEFAVHFNAR